MTAHTSLLDLTTRLLGDDAARSAFADDPEGFLDTQGVTELSPAEIAEGLGFVAAGLPPHLAVQLPRPEDLDADPGSVVDQFRAVHDVDPDLALPGLDDLDAGFEPVDAATSPGAEADADVDPHDALDDRTLERSDDRPDDPEDSTPDDSASGEGDLAFGAGSDAEAPRPAPDAGPDPIDEPERFEVDTTELDALVESDPVLTADDPFLPPEVEVDPGEPDELDADNGDWDGRWDHADDGGIG